MGLLDKLAKRFGYTREQRPMPLGKRDFSGAMQSRLVNDWIAGVTTADAEVRAGLKTVRGRTREAERDCSWTRRFLGLGNNNVLGANGVGLQMKIREIVREGGKWVERYDDRANGIIEECWRQWGKKAFCTTTKQLTWVRAQHLSFRSVRRDGSMFVRFQYPPNNPFHFALEMLEGDHLDTDFSANLNNGNKIRMGTEYNEAGAEVGWHLLKNHPGDTLQPRNIYGPHRTFLAADKGLHLYLPERIGQSEGMPALAATILPLKMLRGFSEAVVVNARVGACKMGFLVPDPAAPGAGEYKGPSDGQGGTYMEAEPGMIEQLPAGFKDFQAFDPAQPSTNYPEYVKAKLREIASGLGVSYNSLANDLEGVNYSSIRAGLLEEREEWKTLQGWFIESFVEPVFEEWLKTALSFGAITDGTLVLPPSKFDKFNAPEWKPRRWAWVDPLKDAQAAVLSIEKRLSSRRAEIADGGGDIETVLADNKADEDLADDIGVELDVSAEAAQPVPATDGEGEPPAKPARAKRFNENHDPQNGQFSSGGGGGSGGGSSGNGSSGSGGSDKPKKERLRDRIEGTQKEADNEVKKTAAKVEQIKAKIAEVKNSQAQAEVATIQTKLTAVQAKMADLKAKIEASNARIAALKAKLK